MNISIPTVTKLVGELMEDGYVIDYGKQETNGGRRPNIYGLNNDSGYFLGVDVEHYQVNIGLINFNGVMIDTKFDIPFKIENSQEKLEELCILINNYIDNTSIDRSNILNVAINLSGRVDPNSGYSYSYFYFDERPLTDVFNEKIGISVSIDNDSRAMMYGEYLNGCVQGEKNIIFLNVSWGLGISIIINGELYYGKSGFSGEFGHYPAFENERLCHCGKKGCLETEASGSYIHKEFLKKLSEGSSSILSKKFKNTEDITIKNIINSALNDDILAIELIEKVGATLGRATAGLINIFNPELVIVGGIVAESGDYFLLPLKSSIKKYSLNLVSCNTHIKLSKLSNSAGLVGACLLARSKKFGLI